MLLAGSTRELRQPVQSGDSPERKTPPPWGVLCSQRGVDQLWAERVPGGLRKVRYKASRGGGAGGDVDTRRAERVRGGLRKVRYKASQGVGAGVAVRPLPPFQPRPPASDGSVRQGVCVWLWRRCVRVLEVY